nr:hypothetical protein CFP56_07990 [Quercus suber]
MAYATIEVAVASRNSYAGRAIIQESVSVAIAADHQAGLGIMSVSRPAPDPRQMPCKQHKKLQIIAVTDARSSALRTARFFVDKFFGVYSSVRIRFAEGDAIDRSSVD